MYASARRLADNRRMSVRVLIAGLALCLASLTACGGAAPTTSGGPAFCRLKVDGAHVALPNGQALTLRGVSVPSLTAMEAAGVVAVARVRALAAAGARMIVLAVEDAEITPTFFPERLAPVLQAATEEGVIVILSYQNRVGVANRGLSNAELDHAEDFINLAMAYARNAPSVWVDPLQGIDEIPLARRRNVTQRLVDLVRGRGADNIIVIREPLWLREGGEPLSGGNVVYALNPGETLDGLPVDRLPFLRISVDAPSARETLSVAAIGAETNAGWVDALRAPVPPNLRQCAATGR